MSAEEEHGGGRGRGKSKTRFLGKMMTFSIFVANGETYQDSGLKLTLASFLIERYTCACDKEDDVT